MIDILVTRCQIVINKFPEIIVVGQVTGVLKINVKLKGYIKASQMDSPKKKIHPHLIGNSYCFLLIERFLKVCAFSIVTCSEDQIRSTNS